MSQSLAKLRAEVNARLRVDLPEVLLEIATRTAFTSKFTHVSEREPRIQDLPTASVQTSSPRAATLGWSRLPATTFRPFEQFPGCVRASTDVHSKTVQPAE